MTKLGVGKAAAVAIALGGCMPIGPSASVGSEKTCMAENIKFLDAWSCVRTRLLARQNDGAVSKRDGLIEEGDLLADQVRAGKVSESEARKRLAIGLSHEA